MTAGVHGRVEEDQLDPSCPGGEGVHLGPSAAVELGDGRLPGRELLQAEQCRVRLAQSLVAGGGVGALVRCGARSTRDPVDTVRLACREVDADQWRTGVDGQPGVRVHEVQVVVGVGEDLHQQGPPPGADRESGCRVRGRVGAPGRRHGAGGERGSQGGGREQGPSPHAWCRPAPWPVEPVTVSGQAESAPHAVHVVRSPRSGWAPHGPVLRSREGSDGDQPVRVACPAAGVRPGPLARIMSGLRARCRTSSVGDAPRRHRHPPRDARHRARLPDPA